MRPEQLRARRLALGLTQAQLAARLGVAANTVARWERGERPISGARSVDLALAALERPAGAPAPSETGALSGGTTMAERPAPAPAEGHEGDDELREALAAVERGAVIVLEPADLAWLAAQTEQGKVEDVQQVLSQLYEIATTGGPAPGPGVARAAAATRTRQLMQTVRAVAREEASAAASTPGERPEARRAAG